MLDKAYIMPNFSVEKIVSQSQTHTKIIQSMYCGTQLCVYVENMCVVFSPKFLFIFSRSTMSLSENTPTL